MQEIITLVYSKFIERLIELNACFLSPNKFTLAPGDKRNPVAIFSKKDQQTV